MAALDELIAPPDPRVGQPPLGSLPTVADLDELTTRVIAPNPSPMTLDGTNTYVVAVPGSGGAVIIDPGPDDPAHADRVAAVLARRDVEVDLILVTHHHVDHAAAARSFARRFGAPIAAAWREVVGEDGRLLTDGDRIPLAGGGTLEVIPTPGHSSDHLAFRLWTGPLFTGDHVLGRGTSVVAYPDGDLGAYLTSLRRLLDLHCERLYPGHGPECTDGEAVVRYYLEHRRFREQQILAALAEGPADVAALVARIYADVDRRLWPAAERSTLAALHRLAAEGRVRLAPDDRTWMLEG